MSTPLRDDRSASAPFGAGLKDYLKEAFFFRWNLLFFLGGVAAAAMAPMSDIMLPLVTAAELSYLAGLIAIPRFRGAIDAKVHAARKQAQGETATPGPPAPSLVSILAGLPGDARQRFERLHGRCVEMRGIAAGVRGAAGSEGASAEEIRTPGLDRLLWLFLRLLLSKTALDRFLGSMHNEEIVARLEQLRKDLAAAQSASDERIAKSLQDSIAMSELRLDNYERAKKNAQFVSIELDRIEGKIQALAEVAGLPQQSGRFGRGKHETDREGGERAAASDGPCRRVAGAAGDPRIRPARGAAA
jgi:hypothetical protein